MICLKIEFPQLLKVIQCEYRGEYNKRAAELLLSVLSRENSTIRHLVMAGT